MNIILNLWQIIVILTLAPLATGLVRKFKAFFQGRIGASIFIHYYTIFTLFKKEMVISRSTTWIFRLVPYITFGFALFLSTILPIFIHGGALSNFSHIVIIISLFSISSVFLVWGGLDSASAFGGMGGARESTVIALTEPAILLTLSTLAVIQKTPYLSNIFPLQDNIIFLSPSIILTGIAFILIVLAENARYPVDNPATHLELTMIHEAMVLEYSGPYLAMLEYAASIKLTLFSILAVHIFWPTNLLEIGSSIETIFIVFIINLIKLIFAMLVLAFIESVIAKMRFYRLQEYFTSAFLLALFGLIFTLISI